MRLETRRQSRNRAGGVSGEARQVVVTVCHHFRQQHDLVALPPCYQECAHAERTESSKLRRACTADDFNEFISQLEGRRFKVGIPWARAQHKSEIDVHNVAVCIDQNITIVPIFNL